MAEGVGGLLREAIRPAGKPPLPAAVIEPMAEVTITEPHGERTHWTGRIVAKAAGVGHRSVQWIWVAHGLKPYQVRSSNWKDPKFAAKLRILSFSISIRPSMPLVLSFDEKSQIQVLDRTHPGLPMKARPLRHDDP